MFPKINCHFTSFGNIQYKIILPTPINHPLYFLPVCSFICILDAAYQCGIIRQFKAFDLVSRDGLFKVLPKIGCPPKLQSTIESFHTDTKGTVQFNGSFSEPFEIRSSVHQGCLMLLKHVLNTATEGIYLRIRSDGRLFNIAHLRAKTKVCEVLIRDMLFADDAAVATHTQEELLSLVDCFSQACKDFRLTISLKKTNVLGQDT